MKRVRDMQMDMCDIYTYDVWDGDDCIVKNPSPYSSLEQAKEAAREYLLENFVPTDRSKDDGFQMALVYNGNETISSGSFDNSYVIASWNKHNNSIAEFNFPKWLRKFAKNPNENLSKWYYNVDKYTDVMDSRKIKDENTPDVLDGVLFIAFTDGTEDDMIAEVNKHANESDTIDGVQYETYETDNSDGVAMIDLCAATGDANAFVKALLNKWGIAENVADLEFEASDEMKEAVNDSRKQVRDNKDYLFNNHKTFNPPVSVALKDNLTWEVEQIHLNEVKNDYISGGIIVTENVYRPSTKELVSKRETRCEFELDLTNNTITFGFYVPDKAKQAIIDLILENFGDYTISDSRVNDMTKPVHLRGYAEKVRAKRRNKNVEPTDELENENQKQDVADSRRVKDERQTFKGQYIGDSPFAKQYESFVDELLKSGKMKRGDLSQADIHDKFEEEMLETSESGDDFEVWAYNDDPRFGDYGEADAGIFVEYDKDGYVTDIYTVG